jgi:hypothetical protein
MVAETKNSSVYPLPDAPNVKVVYDTSTSAATGAARCDYFVGEGFGLLVISYI